MSTKNSGCWQLLLTLVLCILFVTGFAMFNQLNLLFIYVTSGLGIYFLSGASRYFYTGFKELYSIRKQGENKPWENDTYVVRELARPLPVSKSMLLEYHLMDTRHPESESSMVLKHEKRHLPEWQKNMLEGLGLLVAGISLFQQLLFNSHTYTAPDLFIRTMLYIYLVIMLCMLVIIVVGLISQVLKRSSPIPESPQSMPENTNMLDET